MPSRERPCPWASEQQEASPAKCPMVGQSVSYQRRRRRHTTHEVVLRLLYQFRNTLIAPEPQHLLQTPPRHRAQLAVPAGRLRFALVVHHVLHILQTRLRELAWAGIAEALAEEVPADRARGHLEAEVARVVYELEDRVWCVVTLAPTELVDTGVASGAVGVALGQSCEHLRGELGEQEELFGTLEGVQIAVLAHGDDLQECKSTV